MTPTLAGVDGCRDGWVCVEENGAQVTAFIAPSFAQLLERLPKSAIVAIDMPIGLTEAGARECDREARRFLGAPRGSSIFPAPVRAALFDGAYQEVSEAHFQADGRRITKQTFGILPKIMEIDLVMRDRPGLQARVHEVAPEVSFMEWNGGRAMQFRKSRSAGRAERQALIDTIWPGIQEDLWEQLRSFRCHADDLNDAFAALWTARRIHSGHARGLPADPPVDRSGLRMQIHI